jgi:hypothetical protein
MLSAYEALNRLVIPAKARIHLLEKGGVEGHVDSRFRGNDGEKMTFDF